MSKVVASEASTAQTFFKPSIDKILLEEPNKNDWDTIFPGKKRDFG
jgi:hypothetical protein